MRNKFVVAVAVLLSVSPNLFASSPNKPKTKAKNIIIMVPDGMGLFDVTAARISKNGFAGAPLALETLDHVGYVRTYSANSTVTDSAAAASAYACGKKYKNGEICFSADGSPNNTSLLELAKKQGRMTALVVTSELTDATPAAFAAHVKSRTCQTEIARQMVEVTGPDVMLGGGVSRFVTTTPDSCGTSGDFIGAARKANYTVVQSAAELQSAVAAHPKRLLGLFARAGLTPEFKRLADTPEPRLPTMARAALQILENGPKGFFLLIEGSQIDLGNHLNSADYQTGEVIAFDQTVKTVLDWINALPERKQETLLIVIPDHETGGFFLLIDPDNPKSGAYKAGWMTRGHTGGDVVFWSQGPGSERLGKGIENTEIYSVVKEAME
jgi:alkaline phosphatase